MGDTNSDEQSMTNNLEDWPTSFTDTIPVDVDEVPADEMLRSYHLQFSDIPEPSVLQSCLRSPGEPLDRPATAEKVAAAVWRLSACTVESGSWVSMRLAACHATTLGWRGAQAHRLGISAETSACVAYSSL
jgi:hypothetical protein